MKFLVDLAISMLGPFSSFGHQQVDPQHVQTPQVSTQCNAAGLEIFNDHLIETTLRAMTLSNSTCQNSVIFEADPAAAAFSQGACHNKNGMIFYADLAFHGNGCGEGQYDLIGYPTCLPALCNDDEVKEMFLLHEINLPVDCRADINVYEASSAKHDISIECAFATADLMGDEHLYGDLHDTLFHHEDDGSIFAFNGDALALERFTKMCGARNGRVEFFNIDFHCDKPDGDNVPVCIANSCSNEDASAVAKYLGHESLANHEEGECAFDLTIDGKKKKDAKKKKCRKGPKSTPFKKTVKR